MWISDHGVFIFFQPVSLPESLCSLVSPCLVNRHIHSLSRLALLPARFLLLHPHSPSPSPSPASEARHENPSQIFNVQCRPQVPGSIILPPPPSAYSSGCPVSKLFSSFSLSLLDIVPLISISHLHRRSPINLAKSSTTHFEANERRR